MRRVAVTVAGLVGCGRIDFDLVPRVDAETDAPQSGPVLCRIPFGEWTLSPPIPVDAINTLVMAQFPGFGDRSEFDPVFSDDGLSLHFSSDQSMRFVVWKARRSSVAADFDLVGIESADINAAANQHFGFHVLSSVVTASISAPYTGSIGGGLDYWRGVHDGTAWVWTASSVSTADDDFDARLTADGLGLYVVRGPDPLREIYRATRVDLVSDFAAASPVADLNSSMSDSSPAPVGTEGILVVTDRPGGLGGDDIWYAASSTGGVTFDPPYPLSALNSAAFDGEPTLLDLGDTCELIFVSNRSDVFNLYRSVVRRQ